jgi:hypothetical protein
MFTALEKTFIVTRVINPNHFYLYDPTRSNEERVKFIEERLKMDMADVNENTWHRNHDLVFERGEVIGFHWRQQKKWIRCEMDEIIVYNRRTYYFMFALDYGE